MYVRFVFNNQEACDKYVDTDRVWRQFSEAVEISWCEQSPQTDIWIKVPIIVVGQLEGDDLILRNDFWGSSKLTGRQNTHFGMR
ncbi:uncharacterized protein N7500_010858 [Penicillium coprophilum]|uniref:uncharacterized protein n=1 Tax=Penicillium coprophilum TaxID=36646 RepID=UPI00238EA79F|nr:uncharacterized protein N7500_010858 [Penicillium coprophilum]KAJ5150669.1 hypothetical protein N7500_010858 [Penicillium coprophilum]